MIPYPAIDPVALRIGPVAVRWYGIMYLLGFLSAWAMIKREIRMAIHSQEARKREEMLLDILLAYLILGVILGGRLGYCLFYNPSYYMAHPMEILATWHGGMSFHGGAIGATMAGAFFCKRHGESFLKWADRFVLPAPIGLFFGRIGNFINGELYGRPTDVPWAMIFPQGGPIPRHPSQLYEAVLEGPILFLMLYIIKRQRPATGVLFGQFFLAYGALRFFVEFFRQPDPQLGFIAFGWLTMGQLLSVGIMCGGMILLIIIGWGSRRNLTRQSFGE